MSRRFGEFGPSYPRLGRLGRALARPLIRSLGSRRAFHEPDGAYARGKGREMQELLRSGKPVYLLGVAVTGHNSAVSLVEATREGGLRVLCNNEEERFSGIKHDGSYPRLAIETLLRQMKEWGISPDDIQACLGSWNLLSLLASNAQFALEELPSVLSLLRGGLSRLPADTGPQTRGGLRTPRLLGQQFGRSGPLPVIGMRHHDNHAYFSYAVSPFAGSEDPVAICVSDGAGDDAAISLYVARGHHVRLLRSNESRFDSLGQLYGTLSSTQGGWRPLSAEGRFMGAAAWGNRDRQTNPYYHRLRQLLYFGKDGQIHLNRVLWGWLSNGLLRPYKAALEDILGPAIPPEKMWNPDHVLNVEDIRHPALTRERLDRAAAIQMLFEDALFHVVGSLIRSTGSCKLILTGGTALNCTANMRLLEHFDEEFFERYTGRKSTRLQLWVPPVPGDAGVAMGAAYSFAMMNGVQAGERMRHAFYCGMPPADEEIRAAIAADGEVGCTRLGDLSQSGWRDAVADLLAYMVSRGGVFGLCHGIAETGPRALGHRSIVANPCNPKIREILNSLVKFREAVRPLAPMVTLEAAHRFFDLSPGAATDSYNAYNYMVLTVPARPEAYSRIPGVIHKDGTGRIQIVRETTDPFTHSYLKAMGRRVGIEASVNTSLNVGSAMAQTPAQALATLKRSRGMHGLLMIGAQGGGYLAWHNTEAAPKDSGRTTNEWVCSWCAETGVQCADLPRMR